MPDTRGSSCGNRRNWKRVYLTVGVQCCINLQQLPRIQLRGRTHFLKKNEIDDFIFLTFKKLAGKKESLKKRLGYHLNVGILKNLG